MAIKQIRQIDRHPSPDVTLRIKTNIWWQMAINLIAIRHRMLVYKMILFANNEQTNEQFTDFIFIPPIYAKCIFWIMVLIYCIFSQFYSIFMWLISNFVVLHRSFLALKIYFKKNSWFFRKNPAIWNKNCWIWWTIVHLLFVHE